jgi:hypothetical protein
MCAQVLGREREMWKLICTPVACTTLHFQPPLSLRPPGLRFIDVSSLVGRWAGWLFHCVRRSLSQHPRTHIELDVCSRVECGPTQILPAPASTRAEWWWSCPLFLTFELQTTNTSDAARELANNMKSHTSMWQNYFSWSCMGLTLK